IAAYRGRLLRVGEVVFRYHRPRPPCGYLERMLWRGASKALGKGSGIGLYVEQTGVIRVGDPVELIDP
ncbi:MAG: MOSC domain-containing protein, partial [Gammaproteobacteria bacterium]